MMTKLLNQYHAFSARDKRAANAALVVVPCVLLYLAVKFSYGYYASSRQEYIDSIDLVAWMTQHQPLIEADRGVAHQTVDVLGLIPSLAETHQITIDRLQPQNGGKVQLHLQDIPFKKLIEWLQILKGSGVHIDHATVSKTVNEGVVNFQGTFTSQ